MHKALFPGSSADGIYMEFNVILQKNRDREEVM